MKKYFKILFLLLLIFILTGCFSKEEIVIVDSYKEQGRKNAINYIKNKYGFVPEIKSVDASSDCSSVWGALDCDLTGYVTVKATYNGKDFTIFINGDEVNTNGKDDYQFDEIKEDIVNYFKNKYSYNVEDYYLKLNIGGINEYYNHEVDKVLPYIDRLELYYIGDFDLKKIDLFEFEKYFGDNKTKYSTDGQSIILINFRNKEKYTKYKSLNNPEVLFEGDYYNTINIFKESSTYLIKDFSGYINTNYQRYGFLDYNDEVYIDRLDYKTDKITISDINIDDYRSFNSSLENKDIKKISKTYSVQTVVPPLTIYFNVNSVNSKDKNSIYLAYECNKYGKKNYVINNYSKDYSSELYPELNYYLFKDLNIYCDNNTEIKYTLLKINNK